MSNVMFLFLVDLLVHVFDGLETPDKKMEALAKKYIQLVSVCLIDLFSILVDSKLCSPVQEIIAGNLLALQSWKPISQLVERLMYCFVFLQIIEILVLWNI